MDKTIPFPQANDFDKIYNLLLLSEEQLNDNDFVKEIIGVTANRQVSYYTSALMYLGLINRKKCFTNLGLKIKAMSKEMQKVELVNLLLEDDIVRYSYCYEKITGIPYPRKMMGKYVKSLYPNYSDSMYNRRCQAIESWIKWIKENTI